MPNADDGAAEAAAELSSRLASGAVDSLPEGGLEQKLLSARREGRPLRVKLGIDPTAPDIHLGHAVVLGKLREFQDAGHRVVLIVGDYTARVGDPSGRSEQRPMLSEAEIDANAATFQEQALKILDGDPARLEVRRNSEWLDMPMDQLFALARTTTRCSPSLLRSHGRCRGVGTADLTASTAKQRNFAGRNRPWLSP